MGTQGSQPQKVQSHQERKEVYFNQRKESCQSARSSRSIKQDEGDNFVQKDVSFLTSCMAMKCCINEDTTQYEFTTIEKNIVPLNKVNVQAKTISLYSHVDSTVSPANLKERLSFQQNSSTVSKFNEKRGTACVKAETISQNNIFNDKNLHIMSQGKLSAAGSPARPVKLKGTGHFITDECNLASVKLNKPCFSAIDQSVGDVSPPNFSPKAGTVFEFDDYYELPPDLKELDNDKFDCISQDPYKQHKKMIKLSPKHRKDQSSLAQRNHSGSKKPSIQHSKLFKEMQTEEKRKQLQLSKLNLFDDLQIKDSKPIDDQFFLQLDLPEDIRAYLEKTKNIIKKTKLQNGAIYVGEWQNKVRHGFGFCVFPDKSYYFGQWSDGQSAGEGRLVHQDKTVLSGKWMANKLHGRGFCSKTNGASYEGDWFEHLQHGKGVEKWPDNSQYRGDFVKGLKEGQGILIVANGGTYKGSFVKNQISGRGTYRWPDGKVYIGEWLESKMHGQGHLKWKDGSREYKGEFKNDLRSGYGEYSWSFGTKSYRGQWKDGKQHGLGFVREEFEYVEKKSLWQAGKLVKWLPDDADSDDDYVLATTNLYAFQNLDNDSCLNSEERKEWLQSGSDLMSVGNFGDFMRSAETSEPQSQYIPSNIATQNNSPTKIEEKSPTQQKQVEFNNVLSHIIPPNKRLTSHLHIENQDKKIISDNMSNNSRGLAKNKKITVVNKKIEAVKLDQKVIMQKQEIELFKPKQNNSKLEIDQLNSIGLPKTEVVNRYSSHMRLKQQILSAQLAQGLIPKVQAQQKKLEQQKQEKSNHFTTQSSQTLEGSVVDVFLDLSSSDVDAESDQFRTKAGQTAQFKQFKRSNQENGPISEEEYFQFEAEQ